MHRVGLFVVPNMRVIEINFPVHINNRKSCCSSVSTLRTLALLDILNIGYNVGQKNRYMQSCVSFGTL